MRNTIVIIGLLIASTIHADIKLPCIITSKMVLQRDTQVPIWGWADKGEAVTVEFSGQTKKAVANGEKGKWMVKLDPMPACSEPREMTIKGKNTIKLSDVLVGEVWLASGQSNMEFNISILAQEEKDYIKTQKDNTLFRMFCIPDHIASPILLDDTDGFWSDSKDIVRNLDNKVNPGYYSHSAVACFFGLKLQKELGVPVAVIDASWGGRKIDKFISDEGYALTGINYRKVPEKQIADLMEKYQCSFEAFDEFKVNLQKGLITPFPEQPKPLCNYATNEIYNGMIGPLAPYAIGGVIWYQGESDNRMKNGQYFEMLKALALGWSKSFNVKELPLYLVQITPCNYYQGDHVCDNVWACQYKAAEELPNVEVVPSHDTIDKVSDIHPKRKKAVGERLAVVALNKKFGKDVVCTGPRFKAAVRQGDKIVVSFKDIDQGLTTKDGKAPSWFEISKDGKKFVPAEAVIKGNDVVVSVGQMLNPKFVRMGWHHIAVPNLMDKNGWPVFAFPAKEIE